jgi:hypothetical protein
LLGLKNGILTGSLLDRRLCLWEITQIFSAVKDIILGSELSPKGKHALLTRLANPIRIELMPEPPKPLAAPVPKERPSHWSEYMYARLTEVASRAENFRLKADELEAGVLVRNFFENEFAQIVKAVGSIVQRSKLSPREKADAKRNLERLGDVFDLVVHTQNKSGAGSVESATKNGNGNGADDDS